MSQSPLVEDLLSKAEEFTKTMEAFKTAHANYHSMLSDEDEIQDSQDYYESERARIAYFHETLNKFITKASAENYESEVRPEDSISNVGSRTRTRSRASHTSSRKSGGGSLAHVISQEKRALQAMPQPSINSKLLARRITSSTGSSIVVGGTSAVFKYWIQILDTNIGYIYWIQI